VNKIHEFTVIHPGATIADDVEIGPFVSIEDNVVIGKSCKIYQNVTIKSGTRLGDHCEVFSGSVVGGVPQDLKFKGEETTLEIGNHTVIREHCTLNRGTDFSGKTVIGAHCLLMAYVHVAHDCIIGDHAILSNASNLAGHVEIDEYAILGGLVAVHQFVKIGRHAFIGGGSLVRRDVPPYIKASKDPLSYVGINTVGLERRGFAKEDLTTLHDIYRFLFVKFGNISQAVSEIKSSIPESEYKSEILEFIKASERGLIKGLTD